MFNVSCRQKTTVKERLDALHQIGEKVKSCVSCPLSTERTNPIDGRFVEPTDALLVDLMSHPSDDKAGQSLSGDRNKSFTRFFSMVRPSLDINKISFTSAFKCHGSKEHNNFCLSYLSDQIAVLDPVLVIALGQETLNVISGKALELGKTYVTGESDQYLLFGLLHPKSLVLDQEKNTPIWKSQLEKLAELAASYDLKILK